MGGALVLHAVQGCLCEQPGHAAFAGWQGYFGSFQHHPERCPMLLFITPLAPAQLQPLTCRKKPDGAKTNRASSIPTRQEVTLSGPRMLWLNRPAPGCPAGWTHLGPGTGCNSTRLMLCLCSQPGWTHVWNRFGGAGGTQPQGLLLSTRVSCMWHRSARVLLGVCKAAVRNFRTAVAVGP